MNQDSRTGEKLRAEYRTESVIPDLSKTGEFTRLSDESRKTIQELVKIELLNWDKFPRTCSAHHAPSTGQKDCNTALAEYV